MARKHYCLVACVLVLTFGCSSSSNPSSGGGNNGGSSTNSSSTGGAASGGAPEAGGSNAVGGEAGVGGATTSGGAATGGASNTGGTKAAGGSTTVALGGSAATGGASTTGGNQATGGASSTGGSSSASCTNTSTDWQNCGSCGHACMNQGQGCGTKCCVAGKCAPWFGPCITQASGYTTCSAACAAIGAQCAAGVCGGTYPAQYTWFAWGPATGPVYCPAVTAPDATSGGACTSALPWDVTVNTIRCCCAEP